MHFGLGGAGGGQKQGFLPEHNLHNAIPTTAATIISLVSIIFIFRNSDIYYVAEEKNVQPKCELLKQFYHVYQYRKGDKGYESDEVYRSFDVSVYGLLSYPLDYDEYHSRAVERGYGQYVEYRYR